MFSSKKSSASSSQKVRKSAERAVRSTSLTENAIRAVQAAEGEWEDEGDARSEARHRTSSGKEKENKHRAKSRSRSVSRDRKHRKHPDRKQDGKRRKDKHRESTSDGRGTTSATLSRGPVDLATGSGTKYGERIQSDPSALPYNVQNQFPGQFPVDYSHNAFGETEPSTDSRPGLAAEYYGSPVQVPLSQSGLAQGADPNAAPISTGGAAAEYYYAPPPQLAQQGQARIDSLVGQPSVAGSAYPTTHHAHSHAATAHSSHTHAVSAHHPSTSIHKSRGAFDRLIDLVQNKEDVRRMEEYTEYIGVCKHCFDPRSSPRDAPRAHGYTRRSSTESLRKRSSDSLRQTARRSGHYGGVKKRASFRSSSSSSSEGGRKRKSVGWLGAGLAGLGLANASRAVRDKRRDFDDTHSVRTGYHDKPPSYVSRRTHDTDRTERGVVVPGAASGAGHDHTVFDITTSRPNETPSNFREPLDGGTERLRRRLRRESGSEGSVSSRNGRERPIRHGKSHKKAKDRSPKRKGFFSFLNVTSSSSESDSTRHAPSRKRRKSPKRPHRKRSSDDLNATLIGISATAAALAAARSGKRPELTSSHRTDNKNRPADRGAVLGRPDHAQDDGWESASDADSSTVSSGLAFGEFYSGSRGQSVESLHRTDSADGRWWSWNKPSHQRAPKLPRDDLQERIPLDRVDERSELPVPPAAAPSPMQHVEPMPVQEEFLPQEHYYATELRQNGITQRYRNDAATNDSFPHTEHQYGAHEPHADEDEPPIHPLVRRSQTEPIASNHSPGNAAVAGGMAAIVASAFAARRNKASREDASVRFDLTHETGNAIAGNPAPEGERYHEEQDQANRSNQSHPSVNERTSDETQQAEPDQEDPDRDNELLQRQRELEAKIAAKRREIAERQAREALHRDDQDLPAQPADTSHDGSTSYYVATFKPSQDSDDEPSDDNRSTHGYDPADDAKNQEAADRMIADFEERYSTPQTSSAEFFRPKALDEPEGSEEEERKKLIKAWVPNADVEIHYNMHASEFRKLDPKTQKLFRMDGVPHLGLIVPTPPLSIAGSVKGERSPVEKSFTEPDSPRSEVQASTEPPVTRGKEVSSDVNESQQTNLTKGRDRSRGTSVPTGGGLPYPDSPPRYAVTPAEAFRATESNERSSQPSLPLDQDLDDYQINEFSSANDAPQYVPGAFDEASTTPVVPHATKARSQLEDQTHSKEFFDNETDLPEEVDAGRSEWEAKLSQKERKKRAKADRTNSADSPPFKTPIAAAEVAEDVWESRLGKKKTEESSEQLESTEPPMIKGAGSEVDWEMPMSKKDKKKREKLARKTSAAVNPADKEDSFSMLPEAPNPEDEWAAPLSKKDKKKLEKERRRAQGGEPHVTGSASRPKEEYDATREPTKKSKQSFGDIASALLAGGAAAVATASKKSRTSEVEPKDADYVDGQNGDTNGKTDYQTASRSNDKGHGSDSDDDQSFLGERAEVEELPSLLAQHEPLPILAPESASLPSAPREESAAHGNDSASIHHGDEVIPRAADDAQPEPGPRSPILDTPRRMPVVTTRQSSTTAVPIRFRRPPGSPSLGSSPVTQRDRSDSVGSPLSAGPDTPAHTTPRIKPPRPRSIEIRREFQPLYLVEHNRKPAEPHDDEWDEHLPPLPPSEDQSEVSSVRDSDGYESAVENQSRDNSGSKSESPGNASPKHDDKPEDVLGSNQSTPVASRFPPNAFGRKTKAEPEFYSWDDMLREERLRNDSASHENAFLSKEADIAPAESRDGVSSTPPEEGHDVPGKSNTAAMGAAALSAGIARGGDAIISEPHPESVGTATDAAVGEPLEEPDIEPEPAFTIKSSRKEKKKKGKRVDFWTEEAPANVTSEDQEAQEQSVKDVTLARLMTKADKKKAKKGKKLDLWADESKSAPAVLLDERAMEAVDETRDLDRIPSLGTSQEQQQLNQSSVERSGSVSDSKPPGGELQATPVPSRLMTKAEKKKAKKGHKLMFQDDEPMAASHSEQDETAATHDESKHLETRAGIAQSSATTGDELASAHHQDPDTQTTMETSKKGDSSSSKTDFWGVVTGAVAGAGAAIATTVIGQKHDPPSTQNDSSNTAAKSEDSTIPTAEHETSDDVSGPTSKTHEREDSPASGNVNETKSERDATAQEDIDPSPPKSDEQSTTSALISWVTGGSSKDTISKRSTKQIAHSEELAPDDAVADGNDHQAFDNGPAEIGHAHLAEAQAIHDDEPVTVPRHAPGETSTVADPTLALLRRGGLSTSNDESRAVEETELVENTFEFPITKKAKMGKTSKKTQQLPETAEPSLTIPAVDQAATRLDDVDRVPQSREYDVPLASKTLDTFSTAGRNGNLAEQSQPSEQVGVVPDEQVEDPWAFTMAKKNKKGKKQNRKDPLLDAEKGTTESVKKAAQGSDRSPDATVPETDQELAGRTAEEHSAGGDVWDDSWSKSKKGRKGKKASKAGAALALASAAVAMSGAHDITGADIRESPDDRLTHKDTAQPDQQLASEPEVHQQDQVGHSAHAAHSMETEQISELPELPEGRKPRSPQLDTGLDERPATRTGNEMVSSLAATESPGYDVAHDTEDHLLLERRTMPTDLRDLPSLHIDVDSRPGQAIEEVNAPTPLGDWSIDPLLDSHVETPDELWARMVKKKKGKKSKKSSGLATPISRDSVAVSPAPESRDIVANRIPEESSKVAPEVLDSEEVSSRSIRVEQESTTPEKDIGSNDRPAQIEPGISRIRESPPRDSDSELHRSQPSQTSSDLAIGVMGVDRGLTTLPSSELMEDEREPLLPVDDGIERGTGDLLDTIDRKGGDALPAAETVSDEPEDGEGSRPLPSPAPRNGPAKSVVTTSDSNKEEAKKRKEELHHVAAATNDEPQLSLNERIEQSFEVSHPADTESRATAPDAYRLSRPLSKFDWADEMDSHDINAVTEPKVVADANKAMAFTEATSVDSPQPLEDERPNERSPVESKKLSKKEKRKAKRGRTFDLATMVDPDLADLEEETQAMHSSAAHTVADDEPREVASRPQTPPSPNRGRVDDIDFAATVAAGLARSGFDSDMVAEDPSFHRRASPPALVGEADPEEVVHTASRTSSREHIAASKITAREHDATSRPNEHIDSRANPDGSAKEKNDFDATLAASLGAAGFTAAAVLNRSNEELAKPDEPDEFAFTTSKKKKKKKGKQAATFDDALDDDLARRAVEAADAQPREQNDTDIGGMSSQDPPLATSSEPLVESSKAQPTEPQADDEWAPAGRKKGKKGKGKNKTTPTSAAAVPAIVEDAVPTTSKKSKKKKRKGSAFDWNAENQDEADGIADKEVVAVLAEVDGRGNNDDNDNESSKTGQFYSPEDSQSLPAHVTPTAVTTDRKITATNLSEGQRGHTGGQTVSPEQQQQWSFDAIDNRLPRESSPELSFDDRTKVRDSGYDTITDRSSRNSGVRYDLPGTIAEAGVDDMQDDNRSVASWEDWELPVSKTRTSPGEDKAPTPINATTKNRTSYLFSTPNAETHDSTRSLEQDNKRSADESVMPTDYTPVESPLLKRSKAMSDVGDPEQGVKARRRSNTPNLAFRERSDSQAQQAVRHASGSSNALWPPELPETQSLRSPTAGSHKSASVLRRLKSPDQERTPSITASILSNDSAGTERSLRRIGSTSANLRGEALNLELDQPRTPTNNPNNPPFRAPPTPPLADNERAGGPAAAGMSEHSKGDGGIEHPAASSIVDLEAKINALSAENEQLRQTKEASKNGGAAIAAGASVVAVGSLAAAQIQLNEKDAQITQIKTMLGTLQDEVQRLTDVNTNLSEANRHLIADTNDRYATLQEEHTYANGQWQQSLRDLEKLKHEHSQLSNGMESIVRQHIDAALEDKDNEIARLRGELDYATAKIRELQARIQSSTPDDFLSVHDEDYFDSACQQLCQHMQAWVLRFSKSSDNRACRLTSDLKDDKLEARLDNTMLDGSDVDTLLVDRVRRRNVFMALAMTMVWEYVFTRYLFGMDREQRQKLKTLEKVLLEVGPPRAVAQWRATTLTLLSQRPSFITQKELDHDAVTAEIYGTVAALLPPPRNEEAKLMASLKKVLRLAIDLSIAMRTQKADYFMMPPPMPEYDENGSLVRKTRFDPYTMNERSGEYSSNEELAATGAVVRIVLFPLVMKKGDDQGEGGEEAVICPAQVMVVANKHSSRVVSQKSGVMDVDDMSVGTGARSRMSLTSPGEGFI